MRIEVTGKHLDVTDPIRRYAEEKCSRLPRFFNGVLEIQILLTQEPHKQEFEAEVHVDVPKHENFIARTRGGDIYECIDLSVDKAVRQLTDFKERLRSSKR